MEECKSMGVLADVGERLVRFRAQAGLDAEQAAAAARIDSERLDLAEAGEVALTDDELVRLSSVYGVDVTEIFGGRITPFRDYASGG
jgi:transcriptional regulator with XRE-family HTH domain